MTKTIPEDVIAELAGKACSESAASLGPMSTSPFDAAKRAARMAIEYAARETRAEPVAWRMRDDQRSEWNNVNRSERHDENWVDSLGFAIVEPLYATPQDAYAPEDIKIILKKAFQAGFIRGQDAREKEPNINEWFERWLAVFGGGLAGLFADAMTRKEPPTDWKLVPAEPTEEMRRAMRGLFPVPAYMAALKAAPKGPIESLASINDRAAKLQSENAVLREFFDAREELTQRGLLYADTELFGRMRAARSAVLALTPEQPANG